MKLGDMLVQRAIEQEDGWARKMRVSTEEGANGKAKVRMHYSFNEILYLVTWWPSVAAEQETRQIPPRKQKPLRYG